MEERLGTKIDATNTKVEKALDLVAETNTVLEDLELRVAATEEAIEARITDAEGRLKNHVSEHVKTLVLDQLRSAGFDPELTAGDLSTVKSTTTTSYANAVSRDTSTSTIQQTKSKQDRQEDKYWECRRALRLRPIGPGDPHKGVITFMTDHLGLSPTFMESVGQFTVKRVPFGPQARVQQEVVVHYNFTDVRDAVKASARNLADKGPDYGVRLELPDHLKSAMKALQAVSYDIKKKYPHARRNVLFDDEGLDLVLDFSLTEGQWRRITSVQAKERKKKVPGAQSKMLLEQEELDSILDDSTSLGDEAEEQP